MIPETAVQLQNLLKNVVGLENILWAQIAAKGRRDRDEVRSNKTRGTEGRERAAGGTDLLARMAVTREGTNSLSSLSLTVFSAGSSSSSISSDS